MNKQTFATFEQAQAFYNTKSDESNITFCDFGKEGSVYAVRWEEEANEVEHEVVKVRTGVFKVTNSAWMIFNADAGMSGRGANQYGIKNTETGERKIVGSLQKAKKLALTKASQK